MIKLAEILDEYKVNKPIKSWKLNSDDYKSFYQLTEYCDRWGVDWSEVDNYDFNNDYDFFVAVWNSTAADHVQPNYCLFTEDDLEELAANFGLDVIENPALPGEFLIDYNDPNMKKIIVQLNKHSGRK
jgi:hypothetical protein